MKKYNVVVRAYDEEGYREVITKDPVSYSVAVSVDRGVNINLNHNDYYTEIEEIKEN